MPVVKKRNQQTETRLLLESADPVELPPASVADNAVLVQFEKFKPFIPELLQTLRAGGGQELETREEQSRPVVCAHFERIADAERQAASTVTLKDLVNQISSVGIPEERKAVNWRPV